MITLIIRRNTNFYNNYVVSKYVHLEKMENSRNQNTKTHDT